MSKKRLLLLLNLVISTLLWSSMALAESTLTDTKVTFFLDEEGAVSVTEALTWAIPKGEMDSIEINRVGIKPTFDSSTSYVQLADKSKQPVTFTHVKKGVWKASTNKPITAGPVTWYINYKGDAVLSGLLTKVKAPSINAETGTTQLKDFFYFNYTPAKWNYTLATRVLDLVLPVDAVQAKLTASHKKLYKTQVLTEKAVNTANKIDFVSTKDADGSYLVTTRFTQTNVVPNKEQHIEIYFPNSVLPLEIDAKLKERAAILAKRQQNNNDGKALDKNEKTVKEGNKEQAKAEINQDVKEPAKAEPQVKEAAANTEATKEKEKSQSTAALPVTEKENKSSTVSTDIETAKVVTKDDDNKGVEKEATDNSAKTAPATNDTAAVPANTTQEEKVTPLTDTKSEDVNTAKQSDNNNIEDIEQNDNDADEDEYICTYEDDNGRVWEEACDKDGNPLSEKDAAKEKDDAANGSQKVAAANDKDVDENDNRINQADSVNDTAKNDDHVTITAKYSNDNGGNDGGDHEAVNEKTLGATFSPEDLEVVEVDPDSMEEVAYIIVLLPFIYLIILKRRSKIAKAVPEFSTSFFKVLVAAGLSCCALVCHVLVSPDFDEDIGILMIPFVLGFIFIFLANKMVSPKNIPANATVSKGLFGNLLLLGVFFFLAIMLYVATDIVNPLAGLLALLDLFLMFIPIFKLPKSVKLADKQEEQNAQ